MLSLQTALMQEFEKRYHVKILEGYGLSEACSVVSVNTPEVHRIGSVGKPLPHCQVRITEDGEIMVRGW